MTVAALVENVRLAAALLDANGSLGRQFLSLLARARERYTDFDCEPSEFAAHLARLCPVDAPDGERSLLALHFEDLFLAHACGRGDRDAIRHFERAYLQPIRTGIPDVDASEAKLDELRQLLRERLLVGDTVKPPRIARYAGKGSLAGWVQIAAQRLALTGLRRRVPPQVSDEFLGEQVAAGPGSELALLRSRYADEFREALRTALAGLEPKERLLLRLHIVDGLSLTRIAASYRVSQSTASRWFSQAKERTRSAIQHRLREVLGLGPSEVDSLVGDLQSHLDASISQLLREQTAE